MYPFPIPPALKNIHPSAFNANEYTIAHLGAMKSNNLFDKAKLDARVQERTAGARLASKYESFRLQQIHNMASAVSAHKQLQNFRRFIDLVGRPSMTRAARQEVASMYPKGRKFSTVKNYSRNYNPVYRESLYLTSYIVSSYGFVTAVKGLLIKNMIMGKRPANNMVKYRTMLVDVLVHMREVMEKDLRKRTGRLILLSRQQLQEIFQDVEESIKWINPRVLNRARRTSRTVMQRLKFW